MLWAETVSDQTLMKELVGGPGFKTEIKSPARSRLYLHTGVMGEIVLGKVSLFANAENLLDVRQTKWDPLLLPRRAASGAWTVDAWASIEGFALNGGIRLRFGGD